MMNTADSLQSMQQLHDFINAKTGLLFTPDRLKLITPVCHELLIETGLTDISALYQRLKADPALLDSLLSRITIPESYFFRDTEHFEFVEQKVLTAAKQNVSRSRPLTLWSAGCAGGEEAYSLAIMMEQAGWQAADYQILASDISRKALQKARKGLYSAWSFRGARAQALQSQLPQRRAGKVALPEHYLERVNFFYLNLASPHYQAQNALLCDVDVIFCRNVFIYFDSATIKTISQQLFATLVPGGYLLLGPSDPVISSYAPFEVIQTAHGLIYRKPLSQQRQTGSQNILLTTPIKSAATALKVRPLVRKMRATQLNSPHEAPVKTAKHSLVQPVAAESSSETELINALYNQANQLFVQQSYEQALVHLRQISYLNPDLPEAHFTAGLAYLRLQQPEQARSCLNLALKLALTGDKHRALTLITTETAAKLAAAAEQLLQGLVAPKRDIR